MYVAAAFFIQQINFVSLFALNFFIFILYHILNLLARGTQQHLLFTGKKNAQNYIGIKSSYESHSMSADISLFNAGKLPQLAVAVKIKKAPAAWLRFTTEYGILILH